MATLELKTIKRDDWSLNPAWLGELARTFGCENFVETGTFRGDTAAAAAAIFREVHTIELDPTLAAAARVRFADTPHAHVYAGDSAAVLPKILPQLAGRTLFWLDGHYSGGVTARGEANTPVLAELAAIAASGRRDDLVLVDDLRCFQPDVGAGTDMLAGYPSARELAAAMGRIFKHPVAVAFGDVLLGFDAGRGVAVSPLLQACTISRLHEDDQDPVLAIQAEELISEAHGAEREALLQLQACFSRNEPDGIGRHYRLWKGLVTAVSGSPAQACQDILKVVEMGGKHWRFFWYLGQMADAIGDRDLAEGALAIVLKEVPHFTAARELQRALRA